MNLGPSVARGERHIEVGGNTYPHRDAFRRHGIEWCEEEVRWIADGPWTMKQRQELSSFLYRVTREGCRIEIKW